MRHVIGNEIKHNNIPQILFVGVAINPTKDITTINPGRSYLDLVIFR